VIEQEEAAALVLGLNFKKTNLGFDDLRVRQAISHAIDREAIVRAILFGQGTAVRGPFPTSYKWYDKGVERFNGFDRERAESLLDAAGWRRDGGGTREKAGQKLEFTIINQADTVRNQVGDAIVDMLGRIGVSVKTQNLETGAYFQGLGSGPDAYFFNWLWLDFPRIYQVLGDSRFIPAPNWANASVPQVDRAMDAWSFAANDRQLEAAARRIQLAVAEHLPVITLYVPHVVWVHSKRLHGFRPQNPNSLYPYYNDMWLEA
jgi:peptide/nickel transport system substrate-binding protein